MFVIIRPQYNNNNIEQLILNASKKLGINGFKIVIEKDETEVDEDEILELVQRKTLILLTKEESWIARNNDRDGVLNNESDLNSSNRDTFSEAMYTLFCNLYKPTSL